MTQKGRPKTARENAKTVSLKMTPEGWELLQELAQKQGTTRSELMERIARASEDLDPSSLALAQSLGESFAN